MNRKSFGIQPNGGLARRGRRDDGDWMLLYSSYFIYFRREINITFGFHFTSSQMHSNKWISRGLFYNTSTVHVFCLFFCLFRSRALQEDLSFFAIAVSVCLNQQKRLLQGNSIYRKPSACLQDPPLKGLPCALTHFFFFFFSFLFLWGSSINTL